MWIYLSRVRPNDHKLGAGEYALAEQRREHVENVDLRADVARMMGGRRRHDVADPEQFCRLGHLDAASLADAPVYTHPCEVADLEYAVQRLGGERSNLLRRDVCRAGGRPPTEDHRCKFPERSSLRNLTEMPLRGQVPHKIRVRLHWRDLWSPILAAHRRGDVGNVRLTRSPACEVVADTSSNAHRWSMASVAYPPPSRHKKNGRFPDALERRERLARKTENAINLTFPLDPLPYCAIAAIGEHALRKHDAEAAARLQHPH